MRRMLLLPLAILLYSEDPTGIILPFQAMSVRKSKLHSIIEETVTSVPKRDTVHALVETLYKMALDHIHALERSDLLRVAHIGISKEDFALDSIAELLARDADGRFFRLVQFFSGFDWRSADESELHQHLTRLAVRSVKDRKFEIYRQLDRSLANIIRRIKETVDDVEGMKTDNIKGVRYVWAGEAQEIDWSKPFVPDDLLVQQISQLLSSERTVIKALLEGIRDWMIIQPLYRTAVPIISLARAFRVAFVVLEVNAPTNEDDAFVDTGLLRSDLEALLKSTIHEVSTQLRPRRGTDYSIYFLAILSRISSMYVKEDDVNTLFEALSKHLAGLSYDDYKKHHRSKLQRLFRIAHKTYIENIKRDLYAG